MSAAASDWRAVGLRSERGPILLAVMLSVALVALDMTILATAVPSVVADLGGFAGFPWLFSIYLLAQAVTGPLFGRLADVIGRKSVMLAGISLFLLGSLLCGLAWGMVPLIIFRVVQGIGAGAVQPIGMTIMGDIYTLPERAKVQAYIAGVWAAASVVGPALGGVFSDYLDWRWIFFVNLPIGAVALWLISRHLDEHVETSKSRVDYLGGSLVTAGGTLLLVGLLEGGQRWSWTAPPTLGVFAGSLACLSAYVLVSSRVPEPILPLWIFKRPVLNATNAGSLLIGMVMMGLSTYVPLYAQQVLGSGAIAAGLVFAAMTLGWPVTAALAGRLYLRVGFRATAVTGALIATVGGALLPTLGDDTPLWWVAVPNLILGLGFGLIASPGIVAAQASVRWFERGVATASNLFARNLGSAIGVAAFGTVLYSALRERTGATPGNLDQLPAATLGSAIHGVFVLSAVIPLVLVLACLCIPRTVGPPEPPPGRGRELDVTGAINQ
jgi:EmrB/QacA subfamily drug resistance transporter